MKSPEERLCSRSWRLRHSSWLLWSILTLGLANAVGFWIVAGKTKRRSWILFAVGWTVIDIVIWVLAGTVDTGTKANPSHSTASTVFSWLLLANWAGGIVHSFLLRKSWLRWRAHNQPGAWYIDQNGAGPRTQPQPSQLSPQQADSMLRGRASLGGVAEALPDGRTGSGRSSNRETTAWQPPQPVDINKADASAFQALGLTPHDAQRIVLARDQVGGFSASDQLMTAAGLPPHVYLNLQHLLVVDAVPSAVVPGDRQGGRPTTGRRLDL